MFRFLVLGFTTWSLCWAISLPRPAWAQAAPPEALAPSATQQPPAPVQPAPEVAPGEPALDFTSQEPMQSAPQPEPKPATLPPPVTTPIAAPPPLMPAPSVKLERRRPNVVSLSPLGLLIGRIRLNYERIVSDHHGLVLEGIVAPDVLRGFDFVGGGGGLGYRWYWRGSETSGFVGAHIALEQGSGQMPVMIDGDTETYSGKMRSLSITPVVGKRWVFTPQLLMTMRFGVGYAATRYTPDGNADPDAVEQLRDQARKLPFSVEAEVSLGYRF